MTVTDDTQRIYVASLSDYNNGVLHGVWIDLDCYTDEDDVWEQINQMLEESPFANDPFSIQWGLKAEETEIHDTEGFPRHWKVHTLPLEQILELAAGIDEHGDQFIAWYELTGDTDPKTCAEQTQGVYTDEADFGYCYAEQQFGRSPAFEDLESHVDWQQYGEAELTGWSHEFYNGKLYVFFG